MADRESALIRLFKALARPVLGPRSIEPRKGENLTSLAGIIRSHAPTARVDGHLVTRSNRITVPGYTLNALANRDDIIFSIRHTLSRAIGQMEWKIVPDLETIANDLERWQEVVKINLKYPGLPVNFRPQAISPEFFFDASGALRDLIREEGPDDETGSVDGSQIREFFEACFSVHEATAQSHILKVQEAFKHPNPSAESSFRSLLNLIIDDLTVHDAVGLVKNPRLDGTFGELYCIPGQDVRIYRRNDLATPQPPHMAYDWYDGAKVKATYNNLELVYMMANPQQDGYGKPPMEVVLEMMVGSLYSDAYLVDFFQNNNMPYGVFDAGPNISQDDRDALEDEWDNKVRKGQHRILFVGLKEGVKGFLPIPQPTNKDNDIMALLKFWAARKCAVFGLSLNDIGFTEDLHRTTAETQAELTQTRGVESMARLIAGYLNAEVVHGKLWVRQDPENPDDSEGYAAPAFPFEDVKFEFVEDQSEEKLENAQRAVSLVDAGIITRNEAREELSLAPREGGDELILAASGSSLTKVSDLPSVQPPQAEQQGQGGPGGPGGPAGAPQPGAPKPPGGGGADSRPVPPPHPTRPLPEQGDDGATAKALVTLRDELVKMSDRPKRRRG